MCIPGEAEGSEGRQSSAVPRRHGARMCVQPRKPPRAQPPRNRSQRQRAAPPTATQNRSRPGTKPAHGTQPAHLSPRPSFAANSSARRITRLPPQSHQMQRNPACSPEPQSQLCGQLWRKLSARVQTLRLQHCSTKFAHLSRRPSFVASSGATASSSGPSSSLHTEPMMKWQASLQLREMEEGAN